MKEAPKILSKEQKGHNMISDILLITNESTDKKKTFLYEYCGRMFRVEDLDDILISRLGKNQHENKFTYLYQSYKRGDTHIYNKDKNFIDSLKDMKEQIGSYFMTCLQCPETFNLPNPERQVLDN